MSEKPLDVSGMGNPLVDILVNVEESFLRRHGLEKGIMHLIDERQRSKLLDSIRGREIQVEAGGSCPNTMSALGVLGVRSALTGKVGEDEYGIAFEEQIQRRNVVSFIRRGRGPTGTSIILITPDKERTMNTFLGACREYGKDDLPVKMIEGSGFFYFTGYMLDTENQKEAVREALSIAKRAKTRILFDAADPAAVERYRADFLDLIKNDVDIVLANAQESAILTGKPVEDGVRALGEYAEIAVVKNGAEDTRIFSRGEYFTVPSFKVEVKDTTGAGDNFSAGFIYGLIRGFPLDQCGAIASFVAAKTIEKVGARVPEGIRKLVEYTFMTTS
jgi:sugar/nucleoside kinase (ribokinase family)